ncbi:MAG: mechanosensitive ion channel [Chitinophagaceae bacterium]|jgi:small-conductance mechanosensitive channel|nr:mechanosensitive ion channel [Chitinophagaceae bacterium]
MKYITCYRRFLLQFFAAFFFLFFYTCANAQTQSQPSTKAREKFFDQAFSYQDSLSGDDYLSEIQKVFQLFNRSSEKIFMLKNLDEINGSIGKDDVAFSFIKERLSYTDATPNLQNLQMYISLLQRLRENATDYSTALSAYDSTISALRSELQKLKNDTLLKRIVITDTLRTIYRPQLKELALKKIALDSVIKSKGNLINNLKAKNSANYIAMDATLNKIYGQTAEASAGVFAKERAYLWEKSKSSVSRPRMDSTTKENVISVNEKITKMYFMYTRGNRALIVLFGCVFFVWIWYNYRFLINRKRTDLLQDFKFKFITPRPFFALLVLITTIASFADLNAPGVYTDFIQFLLIITLSYYIYKHQPAALFKTWLVFVALLILFSCPTWFGFTYRVRRWWWFFVALSSALFGFYKLIKYKQHTEIISYKIFALIALIAYSVFSLLSAICNLFGRVTLTMEFYNTAMFCILETLVLIISVKILVEAFLLQVTAGRVRKKFPDYFNWQWLAGGATKVFACIALYVWLCLLADQLNLYDTIIGYLHRSLTNEITIGKFSFTFGGIFLFIFLIWLANFLQKNIGYFFGDTGDEAWDDSKGYRSRLIVTRLVLLIVGFLMAVAASGLALSNIVVILGALGIGIGLGLQNIVNNFVSGVILIFDKAIRIGDYVQISDKKGRVKQISVRSSTLLSDDGAEIIIPNGDILGNDIINYTLSNNLVKTGLQLIVLKPFDFDKVSAIIKKTILTNENVFPYREPGVVIDSVNSVSINIRVSFWCKNISNAGTIKGDVFNNIYQKLEENGVKLY